MPRWLKLICLSLPLAAVFAVALDTPFHVLTRGELAGVVAEAPRPELGLSAWWSGTFQQRFETWFERELGFRTALVRSENSLNLAVFREISSNSRIVLGDSHNLYEIDQIDNYNGVTVEKGDLPPPSPGTPEAAAARVGRAARAFDSLGIDFVMVLYPTKPTIRPEKLPSRYVLPGGPERSQKGFQHFMDELVKNQVPLIDGVATTREFAAQNPTLTFWNRGGGHWSDAVACGVVQKILAEVRRQSALRLGEPAPTSTDVRCALRGSAPAEKMDIDLADLSNLWDISAFVEPMPRVFPSLRRPLQGGPLDVLIIGTSFSRHIERLLRNSRATHSIKRIGYYRHFNTEGVVLPDDVQGRRLVIFEQWQASHLTINITEFLDDLERQVPRFAEAMRQAGGL